MSVEFLCLCSNTKRSGEDLLTIWVRNVNKAGQGIVHHSLHAICPRCEAQIQCLNPSLMYLTFIASEMKGVCKKHWPKMADSGDDTPPHFWPVGCSTCPRPYPCIPRLFYTRHMKNSSNYYYYCHVVGNRQKSH
jgi:hypothetical protein